jgi:hypothetical protein
MMAMISLVTALVIISAATVVLSARSMFRSCGRGDFRKDGRTPGMFHIVDPYIAGLVEDLYSTRNTGKNKTKETSHV